MSLTPSSSPTRRGRDAVVRTALVMLSLCALFTCGTAAANAALNTSPRGPDGPLLQLDRGRGGATMGQGARRLQANGVTQPGLTRMGSTHTSAEPVLRAATNSGVPGLDVSGWQPNVDWQAQWNMGARFAYIKATEGADFTSTSFNSQYPAAAAAGMMRGAYHFALPSQSPAVDQADFFLSNGGGWSADGSTLPPLLDIEYNPYPQLGDTCYNMAGQSMVDWVRSFSDEILAQTGRAPAIYTTTDWWAKCTDNSAAFSDSPLHIAFYSTSVGELPASWDTYSIWQYSSTGPFAGDSDVWNGTLESLQTFVRGPSGGANDNADN